MSTSKSSKSRKRKESNAKANRRKIHAAEARKKRACFIFCNYYTVPKCKFFHVKICFVCIRMKTNFHYKNFVRNFIFIMRFKATRTENSPILVRTIAPCILSRRLRSFWSAARTPLTKSARGLFLFPNAYCCSIISEKCAVTPSQFYFWIPTVLAYIYFSRTAINCAKICVAGGEK